MKKLIVAFIAVLAIVSFTASAMATPSCPPGQERKGWKCVDIEVPDGNQTFNTNTNDNSNRNTNMNTNLNSNKATAGAVGVGIGVGIGKGGDGGDASSKSTSSVKNSGNSTNDNRSTAVQGQQQSSTNVVAPTQVTSVVAPVTIVDTDVTTIIDFNHIAADVGKTDADLPNQENAPYTKTVGIYPLVKLMTLADAKAMAKNQGRHIDIIDSLFRTPKMGKDEIRTNAIAKGPVGELMGTITLADAGTKVNADGMFAVALVYGMSKGATHFDIISFGEDLMNQGSKAGIDFGGTASMVAKSDGSSIVGAGSTLGYSTAWSSNEYRPTMTIAFYFDITAIK